MRTEEGHVVDLAALTRKFTALVGQEPQGVWAAPGRVNLIGDHTDYNEGLVMPFALPHATYVAAGRRDDGILRVHSGTVEETVTIELSDLTSEAVTGWAAYVAGVLWALQEEGYRIGGMDLVVETAVPQGAGLSSSAALECSVALAAQHLHDHIIEPLELAKIAQRAENEFVGMPCGLMDQMVAMLGRDGHMVQFDTRSMNASMVPFQTPGAQILVIDTNAPHQLVDGAYAARRRQCLRAAEELGLGSLRELNDPAEADRHSLEARLAYAQAQVSDDLLRRRLRHVVTENQRVVDMAAALAGGDLESAGRLMTASHISLRDDYEVTVPEVDLVHEVLLAEGAYGARITGGGFGGCVIALVRTQDTPHLAEKVRASSATAGFAAPEVFLARPASGARRIHRRLSARNN